VDGLWATNSEGVGLIACAIRFPTYVVLIHQHYRRMDGRTDRRHAIAIPHFALQCIVR